MISFAAGPGVVRAHVESAEAELLTGLVGQVRALLEERAVQVGAGTATAADPSDETALLATLEQALAPLPVPTDEVLARLLPSGRTDVPMTGQPRTAPGPPDQHPGEGVDSAEFRRLTEADLRSGKVRDADTALRCLDGTDTEVELSTADAEALLRSLNDVRLSLGTRLEVTEQTAFPRKIRNEKDHATLIYFWVGGIQEELLDAIIGAARASAD